MKLEDMFVEELRKELNRVQTEMDSDTKRLKTVGDELKTLQVRQTDRRTRLREISQEIESRLL